MSGRGGDTHSEISGGRADVVIQGRDPQVNISTTAPAPPPPTGRPAPGLLVLTAGLVVAGTLLAWRPLPGYGTWSPSQLVGPAACWLLAAYLARDPLTWWRWKRNPASLRIRLDDAAEALAKAQRRQWADEEKQRRLRSPAALPVAWRPAAPWLADHPENLGAGPLQLSGQFDEFSKVFDRLPTRRLVVLGDGGMGKSALALSFVLDRLRARATGERVPVLLPLADWDPARQLLASWVAAQLAGDHPELAARTPSGSTLAEELFHSGRLLLVLDGLDELPELGRQWAIYELNRTLDPDQPLVLTSRREEYQAAVLAFQVLAAAAVVELQPLAPHALASYLPRTSRPHTGADWSRVLAALADPAGPPHLREVLTTPLMTALARTAYSDTGADPDELLYFPTREALEDHLLDRLIPAVYDSGPTSGRWTADQAYRWLHRLARTPGHRITWWEWGGRTQRVVAEVLTRLAVFLAAGATFWAGSRSDKYLGLPHLAWFELIPAAILLLAPATSARAFHRPLNQRLDLAGTFVTCAACVLPLLFFAGRIRELWPVLLLLTPVTVGFWFPARPRGHGPKALLPGDRTATLLLVTLRKANPLALIYLALSLNEVHQVPARAISPAARLAAEGCSLLALVLLACANSCWVLFAISRTLLACCGRRPWDTFGFLADARGRGVIRQVSGGYVFRHARLRDRLAGRPVRLEAAADDARFEERLSQSQVALWSAMFTIATVVQLPSAIPRHTPPPAPCALLSPADSAALAPGGWQGHPSPAGCGWASPTGVHPRLAIGVEEMLPAAGLSGAQQASLAMYRLPATARPLAGICDVALAWQSADPEPVAQVAVRCGSTILTVGYRDASHDPAHAAATAETVARHAAATLTQHRS
ncbi:NACHT domain-containing protein [Kitasatospora sp. LaBMicrA B282]|uniref:NACHT domain-containing protein n=1 Tax=Kitasatospora sp. LaBMicrA B282 TaxID=3420949 RepID=UPI003D1179F1